MNKRQWGVRVALAIGTIGIVLFFFCPLPYYIEQPGSTIDLKELITVNDKQDTRSGEFALTSVGIRQATPLRYLMAKQSAFEEVLTKEEFYGEATSQEYDQMQAYYMESAQNNAIQEAFSLAQQPYTLNYEGVYIMSVDKQSDFYGKLAVGDTVIKVDGQRFDSSQAFMDAIQAKTVGTTLTITYLRDGKEQEATGKLILLSATKKPGIGISLVDHTTVDTSIPVTFHVENIGGPSAGLMFTLEIYEQLTQQNLRKGYKIAGTGTIDEDGTVGRIGGIDKKVASASKAGFQFFFAPDDTLTKDELASDPNLKSNYEEAQAAAKTLGTTMKIIPVKTVQDALEYLQKLP